MTAVLIVNPFSNEDIFEFSIDGGQSFGSSNTFGNLESRRL